MEALDDIEALLLLFFALWLVVTENAKRQSEKRIEEARRKTLAKKRKLLQTLQEYDAEDERLRAAKRRRMKAVIMSSRRIPSIWKFDRTSEWWDVIVPGFTKAQWVENFRMSEETFDHLCNKLRPAMELKNTNFRRCMPLKKRVAIALWKLATGSQYRSIGHLFGVSLTSVCRCVQDFCAAAETLLVPEQIRFPNHAKFAEMSSYYENRWGLPRCVGVIHASHIPIIAPQDNHCDYVNSKGWRSIILQGVVDGKGLFWNVFAGMSGSLHDAKILRLSPLWELATRGNHFPAHTSNIGGVCVGYYILGDSAYPLQNWLLKPFEDTGRLTAEQQTFNRKFSEGHAVAENAFVRLKGRWRCLLKRNDCDLPLVKSMVVTCCALHNLCESRGEGYESEWDAAAATAVEPGVAVAGEQDVEEEGRDVREGLMRYLLSDR